MKRAGRAGLFAMVAIVGCSDAATAPAPAARSNGGPACASLPRDAEHLSQSCDTYVESEPHVAVTPKGRVAAAWIGLGTISITIGTTLSDDGGATWSPVQEVAAPSNRYASDPVLASDDTGTLLLTYIGFRATSTDELTDMHLYVARAAPNATAFDMPLDISYPTAAAHIDKPWIVRTPKGAWLIVHAFDQDTTGGLAAARSVDGTTFDHAVIVEGSTATSYRNLAFPCVSAETGRVYVAYFEVYPTAQGVLHLRWSDDDGVTWPAANLTTVTALTESMAFGQPMCAARGSDVWLTYGLSADKNVIVEAPTSFPKLRSIRLAHSADSGVTIASRVDVEDANTGSLFLHPALAAESDGSLDLTYYAGTTDPDANGAFVRARMPAGSMAFGSAADFANPIVYTARRDDAAWIGDYSGLAWHADALYATWVDSTSGKAHVVFGRAPTP